MLKQKQVDVKDAIATIQLTSYPQKFMKQSTRPCLDLAITEFAGKPKFFCFFEGTNSVDHFSMQQKRVCKTGGCNSGGASVTSISLPFLKILEHYSFEELGLSRG